jgi:tetratricopeptide (TPR) repeat protein
VAARVADGLAHAHERGILHRDLKPANILFADDGEPVLLDFNLAADTSARAGVSVALVGGTLPYMAPEHLGAFREGEANVDARSDVYALGVILYELLTGAHPFPVRTGPVDLILPGMIADRRGPVPDVRRANPAVSPAVASIVGHCLEPDPARRYRSARELQEDLRRQLDDLPLLHAPEPSWRERLRKWARRHPRLTSSTTVGLVSTALLLATVAAFVARNRHYQAVEAAASFRTLADERGHALTLLTDPDADPDLIRDGIEVCRRAAERYHVLDDPLWLARPLASFVPAADRGRLREELGDLLFLWGRALTWRSGSPRGRAGPGVLDEAADRLGRAEACYGPKAVHRALVLAEADLARRSGRGDDEVKRLRAQAEAIPLRTPRERLLAFVDRAGLQSRRELAALFGEIEGLDQRGNDFVNWVILGNFHLRRLGHIDEAIQCYGVAAALEPRLYWPRFNRGLAYLEKKEYSRAIEDFDRVIELRPDWPPAYFNRAVARLEAGDAHGAVADLDRYLGMKGAQTRGWFARARAKERLGDRQGARLDVAEGLKRTPDDEASYVARGLARLPRDPAGALADYEAALAINPRYVHALQDKASVLSEQLKRPEEAVAVLDTLLLHHPGSVPALAGRGVLLARLGRREAAVKDAGEALGLDRQPMTVYQAACVYALGSRTQPDDRAEAFRLLADAFRKDDGFLLAAAPTDPDLAPVRDRKEFRDLLGAFAVVRRAGRAK